ncbi:MAG: MgtC/SapB family protein [Clostridia bacterium]|nr:MgtC/SapB family protein [Clostridia bacterium]
MDIIGRLLGEWSQEFNVYSSMLKIAICLIIGITIGSERARNLQAAGLKTFMFVSLSSVIAGMFDFYMTTNGLTVIPIACPIIILSTGIISSNTILFNSKNQFRGLTTSVGIICTEAMALVISYGFYFIGVIGLAIYIAGVIILPKLEIKIKRRSLSFEIYVELKTRESLQKFIQALRQLGLKVNGVELNPAYVNSGLAVYSVALKINKRELNNTNHKEIIEAISSLDTVNFIEEIL